MVWVLISYIMGGVLPGAASDHDSGVGVHRTPFWWCFSFCVVLNLSLLLQDPKGSSPRLGSGPLKQAESAVALSDALISGS
jgi:hypothetical protein